MKKKVIVMAVGVLLIISGGILYFKNQSGMLNPFVKKEILPSPSPTEPMTTWKDPMGFTFSFPKSLVLNPHDEDKDNYAHVELTATGSAGSVVVWVADATYSSLDEWVNKDKSIKGGNAIDTTWGGEKAKKVILSGDNPRVETAVFYDNLFWLAEEIPGKGNDWDKAYNNIIDSFKFYPLNQSASGGSGASGGEGGGDEEVVQ